MHHLRLGLLTLLTPTLVLANSLSDGRSQGMAGAAIASGDYTQTAQNPALLTRFNSNDDFYLRLGVGAMALDFEDTLDEVDQVQADIDAFDRALSSGNQAEASRLADEILTQFEALEQRDPQGSAAVGLAAYLPSKSFGFGMSISSYALASGLVDYVDSDRQVLDDAIKGGSFNEDDLKTNADMQAVVVSEVAFTMAREFNLPWAPQLSLGIAPKLQRIDSYFYNANVASFDEDDVTDDINMTDDTKVNLDIGIHHQYGAWSVALVARNLISQEIIDVKGRQLQLNPTATLGGAFQHNGFSAELNLDLLEDDSFAQIAAASQWLRAGIAYDLFGHAQLRAGYRTDLASNYSDVATIGLGISPWDTVTFDVAGQLGQDDEVGGQLQLGLKF